jgi:membrane protease YdiL (CAAX protease family)
VLDLVILSLGFLIHLWALPYSFKNLFIDSLVRFVQLGFGVAILITLDPRVLLPSPFGLITGLGVGVACFAFQIVWNKGVRLRAASLTRGFIASQLLILFFHVPAEEMFYRGVFFTLLSAIWGPFTALVISTALSTMIAVVSSRKPIKWLGSGLVGVLCGLGYYWSQSIWAPMLIHILNDFGFDTLNEQRNLLET